VFTRTLANRYTLEVFGSSSDSVPRRSAQVTGVLLFDCLEMCTASRLNSLDIVYRRAAARRRVQLKPSRMHDNASFVWRCLDSLLIMRNVFAAGYGVQLK
jgi:hypothetical protein